MNDSYQTVPLPDGSVQSGLFPSIEWFGAVRQYVNFRGAKVLDLGCCQFSYGIQALNAGAIDVVGVDRDPQRVTESRSLVSLWNFDNVVSVIPKDALDYIECLYSNFDIVIVGMLIHWYDQDQAICLLKASFRNTSRALVVIYRQPTADGTGFCPTGSELDHYLECSGIHQNLMDTDTQKISLAVYHRKINL